MKLLILKENLLKGLNMVSRVTSKSITLPILNNILLSTEKNFLKISATDLEIGIQYWVLSKTEEEGSITIPAKFLASLISFMPDKKISLKTKGDVLFVEGENYKNEIKGLSADDFPVIPEVKEGEVLEVNSSKLISGFSQIVNTASPSQTRPEISGIYLSLEKRNIEMAATDSFRLAEKKILIEDSFKEKTSLIVLQKTIREAINIFGEDPSPIKIYFSPNQIMFESKMEELSHPRIRITSRLIEGEYPNYKEVIPSGFKTKLVLNKQDFLNKIKAASLFSNKVNEVKLSIIPDKKLIEIFSQNSDLGESKSQIKGEVEGEKIEASFNHRFIVDGISSLEGEKIILELNGEEGPGVLRSAQDESFTYVVMPIKNN
jgi:DNA polymerase III subunit beta